MATSSSNKMPLLVDRPLHSFATIGGAAALTTATNFNTPSGGGCVLLVDCLSNDGAVVDSISIVANEASTTASKVLVFLSVSGSAAAITAANTVCVASETIGSTAAGDRTNISLPPLSVGPKSRLTCCNGCGVSVRDRQEKYRPLRSFRSDSLCGSSRSVDSA